MKLFLLGVLSGLCTFGLYFYTSAYPQQENIDRFSSSTTQISKADLPNTALENVIAENAVLRTQLAELRKNISTQSHTIVAENVKNEPSAIDPKEISAAVIATQMQINQLRDFIHNNPKADISKIARQNFEREAVDNVWASDFQLKLDNYLKTNPNFSDFVPQTIECRTSRCRISVAVADSQDADKISQIILNNILSNKEGITKKIIFEQDPNQASLNFYIAKNDEQNLLQ